MQQAIMFHNWRDFLDELNALLLDGWKIVPGSVLITHQLKVALPSVPSRFVDANGHCLHSFFFAVVQNDDVR